LGSLRSDYVAAVKRASLVLVNSHYSFSRIQEVVGELPHGRVVWLGTEQDHAPSRVALDNPEPVLMFVGRSDEMFAKGQEILVDIWPDVVSEISNAKLIFVGGGENLSKLTALVKASPVSANIEVHGMVSESTVEKLWQRATALAMLSYVEGFGLVFIEAMRHQIPIIASTEDASQEINVDGVTGFNVSRKDRFGIIERVVFFLKDPDRAAAYGRAGFERWLRHFKFTAFRDRLLDASSTWLGLLHPDIMLTTDVDQS